jgi:hypothetical protein
VVVDSRSGLDELMEAGSGVPAPAPLVALYHQAFKEFRAQALWNRREIAAPTITEVLVVANCLRREGSMKCRPLIATIEEACRAAVTHPFRSRVVAVTSDNPGIDAFFPAVQGRLHAADLATNKALDAAGLRDPRDVLDLLHVHDSYLPIGAVVWAAVAKAPGFSPDSLIAEIRRNARYRADEYDNLNLAAPVDAGEVSRRFRHALEEAEAFVRAMPVGKEGLLFLKDGQPVQPDPAKLTDYVEHAGSSLTQR